MKLFLLFSVISISVWGCNLSATTSTGTVCLDVPGPAGPPGPQGPKGDPGAGIPTISVSGNVTTITGDLQVTGSVGSGTQGKPTVWTITRADGKTCPITFEASNPSSTRTVMVIGACQ